KTTLGHCHLLKTCDAISGNLQSNAVNGGFVRIAVVRQIGSNDGSEPIPPKCCIAIMSTVSALHFVDSTLFQRYRVRMKPIPKTLVESFYADVWNRRDFDVAHDIIAADFGFRGSLGSEKKGIDGFLEYVDAVHAALGNYTCIINDLVLTDDRVAARMTFRGTHQAEFFGVAATKREIEWAGAAFFTLSGNKLSQLWVLGDVDAVKQQLGASSVGQF
ncbi:ester cyclase, partial [Ruegeria sp. HKCCA6837]|uniref:ester cyclase n=1 Tax=Ruegeria sp. HKCCA6837 TaxID=2682989 RepID=UPI001C2BCC53